MPELGRFLILLGVVLLLGGLLLTLVGSIPGFGKLPGDIVIKRGNVTLYFPLTTSLLLSIVLTVILSLFFRR